MYIGIRLIGYTKGNFGIKTVIYLFCILKLPVYLLTINACCHNTQMVFNVHHANQ